MGEVLTPWEKSSVVVLWFLQDFYQWEFGHSVEFGLGEVRNLRRNTNHIHINC